MLNMLSPLRFAFNSASEGESPSVARAKFFAAITRSDANTVEQTILQTKKECLQWKDDNGLTALMRAAKEGLTDMVTLLLKSDAPIDAGNEKNSTALMFAAAEGKEDVAAVLMDKGADVNHTNITKATPLMLAAWNGNMVLVKWLVEKGADITAKDKSGKTALDYAKEHENTLVADFLAAPAAKPKEVEAEKIITPTRRNDGGATINALASRMKKAGLIS